MRKQTPSFILELPLSPDPKQSHSLRSKFEAARYLYNALLGEALNRYERLTQSPEWAKAGAMAKSPNKQRQLAFSKARELYGFNEYALHRFATNARVNWLAEHIDSVTAQTLASRAFSAVNKLSVGFARKVRFKSMGRGLNSLEGKSNKSGLRFLLQTDDGDEANADQANSGHFVWGDLHIEALIDWSDPLVRHGLRSRIKYVRLVRRKASSVRAKGADCTGHRYYVQLILEGKPYRKPKNEPGNRTIGLDIGPQTIAIVSCDAEVVRLTVLAEELVPQQGKKRRLERKLDRQRRANNKGNYDEKGRIKKGKKIWKNSRSYNETRRRLSNAERRLAAQRKSLHGKLANEIVREGGTIKLEKVSYKGWQKRYGRSVGLRAPAMFVERVRRTVLRTGGTLIEFPTWNTFLSQVCHRCGCKKKKSLAERYHECGCGIFIQRDIYSAYLASHIDEHTKDLSITQSDEEWAGVEALLMAGIERVKERAKEGEEFPRSMGVSARARARLPQSLHIKVSEDAEDKTSVES